MQKFYTAIAALLLFATVHAQDSSRIIIDKIVGIVGDKIILQSDIYNSIQDRLRHGESIHEGMDCEVMEEMLGMKGLLLQALKDSLVVEEEELDNLLDNQVRGFIRFYGSKEEVERIAGKTIYQIKEDMRQPFKERLLAERMRDRIVSNLKVSPQEVNAYFAKFPQDSLPFLESQLEIGQVIVYPKASRELEKMTIDELNEYKRAVESGQQKFETLAMLYSKDPLTRDHGGRVMINRSDKFWGTDFIDLVFRLKEGQISGVIQSKSGYHLIQMISREGDDAEIRHILRVPPITASEMNGAIKKLDSVRARLIAGTISFGEAVRKYSEDETAAFSGGLIPGAEGTSVTIDQLDKDLVELLAKTNLKAGEFSQPVPFTNEQKKQGVRIVYVKSQTAAHRLNLKDDYDRIARQALEAKKQQAMENWLKTKLPSFYVRIDDFESCNNLDQWMQYRTKE